MVKEQIMQTAFDLFSQYGIKSVSMNDIARNSNVSKRTLYELFADKEALLVECIDFTYNQYRSILEEMEVGPYSVIEAILLFLEEMLKKPRWYTQKYYDDLKRYPNALDRSEKNKAYFFEKCHLLLNRGLKEGVFKPEVNFEILALLAKEQAKMLKPSQAFSNHSNKEVLRTILYTFLRGISTEKGIAILDRFVFKQSYNIQG